MNSKELIYASFILVGTFCAAISQVMLKKAAMKEYESKIYEYLNPVVIIAYIIYVFTTLLSVYAYKGIPLSMGSVLGSTSYIYITVFGLLFFDEKINLKKIIGLIFIISGIAIYAILG